MKLEFIPTPNNYSTTMFGGAEEFKKNVLAENSCIVDLCFMTKTYLSISIRSGSVAFGMNDESDYSKKENLTLIKKTEMNYFQGYTTTKYYFKVTKKQNRAVLSEHIISLVYQALCHLYLVTLIDVPTFKVSVWTPKELL